MRRTISPRRYCIAGTNTYRILQDERGSARLVVNTANGAVAQELDYDEFGRVLSDSAPGFQPFGFAGGLFDPDTGLVRFGARDYLAGTGMWTARDPLLFDGLQLSLYAYVNNDPVNLTDHFGTGPNDRRKIEKLVAGMLWTAGNRFTLQRHAFRWLTDPEFSCVAASAARSKYLAGYLPENVRIRSVSAGYVSASGATVISPHTYNVIEIPGTDGQTHLLRVNNYLYAPAVTDLGTGLSWFEAYNPANPTYDGTSRNNWSYHGN